MTSLWRFVRDLTVADIGRILTLRRPRKGAAAPPAALVLAVGPGTPAFNLRCARRTTEAVLYAYARSVAGTPEVSDAEMAALARHAAEHLAQFATQVTAGDVEVDVPDFIPDDLDDLTGGDQ